MMLNLFAGPGGIDKGAGILDLGMPVRGFDIDADACATAVAAGFDRTRASVLDLNPDDMRGVTVAAITPPCPPFSRSGLGKGHKDYPKISEALTLLGDYFGGIASETAYREALTDLHDPRSALVVETLRFAFLMPDVRVVVAEQVPGVTQIWKEIGAELAMAADWIYLAVASIAAEDLGLASRRTRTFLIAVRRHEPDLAGLPMRTLWTTGKYAPPLDELVPDWEPFPAATMADALGWPAGEKVNTRGNRKATGGNLFSADGPAWCLTEKARTWYRVSDGLRLTESDAGLLMGFPKGHPWSGARSKCFLQAADAVSPPVAAAVLGCALGRDWQQPVRDYLANLYPSRTAQREPFQPSLFGEVA